MGVDIENMADFEKSVKGASALSKTNVEWRTTLASECQVFVCGENYLAKRFDQINFSFCSKDDAKDIIVDNLYALLRYRYFPKFTDENEERIKEIIESFTRNLKSSLIKVNFDKDSDNRGVSFLPNSCIAFRNGVYDFKNDDWFFRYDVIDMDDLHNKIYRYDFRWIITWYIDMDFEPLGISVMDTPLDDFVWIMKELVKSEENHCFKLMYNMSHTAMHNFDMTKFKHLCEILGYTVLQSFSQNFVILVGSGQNGKNSLFDGCFVSKVMPRPASNDLDSIENDRFVTGSLENRSHNIFLESSPKLYVESKMLKALTGSMYQTVEQKGINKYSSVINCKYIFASNDQDKIKFQDTSTGFRRRVNIMEIWYRWDAKGKYLSDGDYYETNFSDTLGEIKDDPVNAVTFIYFAMYGIKEATNGFKDNFKFGYNDWKMTYADVDTNVKFLIDNTVLSDIYAYLKKGKDEYDKGKTLLFDSKGKRLYLSHTFTSMGYKDYDDLIEMLGNDEESIPFFNDRDIYVSLRVLQDIIKVVQPAATFTAAVKKAYDIGAFSYLYNNQPYAKCTFIGNKLKLEGR